MKIGSPRARSMAGAALIEFAMAWPVALLLVLGCVEVSVWAAEAYAARAAALAAARAGSVVGASSGAAAEVAVHALGASLIGAQAAAWCPGQTVSAPQVWVCVRDQGLVIDVTIGGIAPALVPLVAGSGLPLHAEVILQKEAFNA